MKKTRICWFSRHDPLPSQEAELKRIYGDVEVLHITDAYRSGNDIARQYQKLKGDEMVLVAPLSVIRHVCMKGIYPLWADMQSVSEAEAETSENGRHYRFNKFQRCTGIDIHLEDVVPRK